MQIALLWYDLDKNSRAVEFVKSVNQGIAVYGDHRTVYADGAAR